MKKSPAGFRSDLKDSYFNYLLREARLKNGDTIKALGKKARINPITLYSYERCHAYPPKEKASRICHALGKDINDVFPQSLQEITSEIREESRKKHHLTFKHLDAFRVEDSEEYTSEEDRYSESDTQEGIYPDAPNLTIQEPASTESSTLEKAIYFSLLGRVRKLLKTLPRTDAELIKLRFGIDNIPHTLHEIAQRYSTTRQSVYNYLESALRRLKHPRRLVCLSDFLFSGEHF